MARYIYQGIAVDQMGNVLDSATVTVYEAGGTTAATIYSAYSGGSAVSGSAVTSDSYGHFYFYIDDSDYTTSQKFKIIISKTNFTSKTFDYLDILPPIPTAFTTLANDATPSVSGGRHFLTGGTTTITDFDDGVTGQVIVIVAEHSVTITDGTNIFLNGSTNFAMTATDTLTLIQKADGLWYELSRGDNGA